MSALYNEIEPYAAQWIRNLAAAGHVAPGVVDERSIKEIQPEQLGNGQVHLFAGIAVWSHALRLAGYPDSFPIWSASCPCQPFSSAGRGEGVDDPRHLWPDAFRLIKARRPLVVVGEQVSAAEAVGKFRRGTRKRAPSASGSAWIDAVHADLESAGYAVGFVVFPAASVGAPHQRHRLYWAAIASDRLAHHHQQGRSQFGSVVPEDGNAQSGTHADGRGATLRVANDWSEGRREVGAHGRGSGRRSGAEGLEQRPLHGGALGGGLADSDGTERNRSKRDGDATRGGGSPDDCSAGRLGFAGFAGFAGLEGHAGDENASGESRRLGEESARPTAAPGPTNGHWRDVEWLPCRDNKWRPTQPGLLPLAHGATERVGRLKAFGNAIVAPQAAEFLQALKPCVEHLFGGVQ